MEIQNETSEVQTLMYVKTNIAGYFFDAILKTDYSRSLTITSSPVMLGANLSDHAYVNPVELIFQIGMSDTARSIINGQFSGGTSRSLNAFRVLAELQEQRAPLNVMTRLGSFRNMLIESIAVPDDYTTLYGLRATVTMKEIFIAQVGTAKVSARPHVTDTTNLGMVQPQTPDASTLYQAFKLFGYTDDQIRSMLEKLTGG